MYNETLIAETDQLLRILSADKVRSVRDFAAFLVQQEFTGTTILAEETEEEFRADIRAIMQHNPAFNFLHDEPDLYSEDDLLERYESK